ncbi:hypothetical protein A0H81_11923 [Grifola frondosa]|uniref:Uncharacterized protein n=1 Tax=Grifola frondosa TaxID=5627 RepID=A0A1C7LTC0_GRIFR|nr:hypothetical protein A0H81_11923 [Grifola frondosa]
MEAELRRQLRASKRREAQQSQKNLELQREVQRLSDALVALLPKNDDLGLKESDYGGESSTESESKDSPLAVWDEFFVVLAASNTIMKIACMMPSLEPT